MSIMNESAGYARGNPANRTAGDPAQRRNPEL
jgi:hypothetical protein